MSDAKDNQAKQDDLSGGTLNLRHQDGPVEGELSLKSDSGFLPLELIEDKPVVDPTDKTKAAEPPSEDSFSVTTGLPATISGNQDVVSHALTEPIEQPLSKLDDQLESPLMPIEPVESSVPVVSPDSQVPIQPAPNSIIGDPLSNNATALPPYIANSSPEPLQPFSPNIARENLPPPPPNPVPFFLDPRGPYARIGAQPVANKRRPRRRRKGLGAILTIFGLIIAAGLTYVAMQGSGSQSEGLFQAAIANSFATSSFTQTTTIGEDSVELQQDVSDVKNPKVSGTVNVASKSAKFDGYGSLKNSYIQYTQLGSLVNNDTNLSAQLTHKWVQIRNDGTLPANYASETALEGIFDPRTSIFGSMLAFGNYAPADQQTLIGYIQQNNVFSFTAGAAQPTSVDGKAATQFEVTVNASALKELNKKAGAMAGLPATELEAAITAANFDALTSAKINWVIADDSQQIVKLIITANGQTTTTAYSTFGTSTVATEPTADYQYVDFQQLLSGKADASLATKAEDIERQADITSIAEYLEKYYETNNFYPVFANMNNISWVEANLVGLPDATLRDPKGNTNKFANKPTVNQYAYQVYRDKDLTPCEGNDCLYFVLTATYTDGTPLVKATSH